MSLLGTAAVGAIMLACRKDPLPAPTVKIKEPANAAGDVVFVKQERDERSLRLDDAGLHLRFETTAGNRVSFLGTEVTAGVDDVTVPDALARFADARALEEWIDFDNKVVTPDGRTATEKIRLRIDRAMSKRIEAVRTAPVRFPGETLAASTNKLAYVRPALESLPAYVIGDGRWRDIDLVAFESSTTGQQKYCGVQQAKLGAFADVPVLRTQTNSHVELYDRRAGKRVDEATITGAPPTCPGEGGGDAGISNEPGVRAWIASKLALP